MPAGAAAQRFRKDSFPSDPHFDPALFPPSPRAGPQSARRSLTSFPGIPGQHSSRRSSSQGRHPSSSFGDVPPPHLRGTPPSGPLPQPFINVANHPTPPHTHPHPSPHHRPMPGGPHVQQQSLPRGFPPGSSPSSAPLPTPGGPAMTHAHHHQAQLIPSPHLKAQHARTRQLSKEDIGVGSGRSSSISSPGSESSMRDRRSVSFVGCGSFRVCCFWLRMFLVLVCVKTRYLRLRGVQRSIAPSHTADGIIKQNSYPVN